MRQERICRCASLAAAVAICLGLSLSGLSGRVPGGLSRDAWATIQAPPSDLILLHFLSALSPHSHFVAAVTVDIDRDGDLDIIATTERDLEIWINQGRGRFTEQPVPERTGAITARECIDAAPPSTAAAVLPRTLGKWLFATVRSWHVPQGALCSAVSVVVAAPARQLLDPSLGRAPPSSTRLA